jgi:hypothetical protein
MFGARPGHGLAAMFGPKLMTLESDITTRSNSLGSNITVRLKMFKTFFIFLIFF